jgi:hypothetical protein
VVVVGLILHGLSIDVFERGSLNISGALDDDPMRAEFVGLQAQ